MAKKVCKEVKTCKKWTVQHYAVDLLWIPYDALIAGNNLTKARER